MYKSNFIKRIEGWVIDCGGKWERAINTFMITMCNNTVYLVLWVLTFLHYLRMQLHKSPFSSCDQDKHTVNGGGVDVCALALASHSVNKTFLCDRCFFLVEFRKKEGKSGDMWLSHFSGVLWISGSAEVLLIRRNLINVPRFRSYCVNRVECISLWGLCVCFAFAAWFLTPLEHSGVWMKVESESKSSIL